MVKVIILNKSIFLLMYIKEIKNIIKDLYDISISLETSGKGEL